MSSLQYSIWRRHCPTAPAPPGRCEVVVVVVVVTTAGVLTGGLVGGGVGARGGLNNRGGAKLGRFVVDDDVDVKH